MQATQSYLKRYEDLVFRKPLIVIAVFALLTLLLAPYAQNFRLDASSDSLVLENDESLRYFREEVSKYSTADLLVLTYAPEGDLFSDEVLTELSELRDKLAALDGVDSIISILDVPLVESPPVNLAELTASPQYLLDERTDRALAREELRTSELYRDFLVSDDYSTTALAVSLVADAEVQGLHERREELRQLRAAEGLSEAQVQELEKVSLDYQVKLQAFQDRQAQLIETVRGYADEYRDNAKLFLGGLPMIVADSIQYINADVAVFGGSALLVILIILVVAFRQFGWVMMPLISCFVTGFIVVCMLGLLNWPISVVSSNFLSLLLIITLSLNIHLIVRFRELVSINPEADQLSLLSDTVRSKFIPCLYTSLTTMVAFASLIVSGIRPVIDFGWIMCLGISISLITTFTLFPALATFITPRADRNKQDPISKWVLNAASVWQDKIKTMTAVFGIIALIALYGVANLTVENRFIDYFKPETEIYQGMYEIDTKLGGTTPLDIILDAPASFFEKPQAIETSIGNGVVGEDDDFLSEFEGGFEDDDFLAASTSDQGFTDDDFLDDDFLYDDFSSEASAQAEPQLSVASYWYNQEGLNRIKAIQADLEAIPETGKVLSLASTMSIFENLRDAKPLDNIDLSFFVSVVPDELQETLFKPYVSADGNQVHINIRVFETARGLDRNELISNIRTMLVNNHGLEDEQVNISGMLVLYNNMLNSLFQSQILTLGTVFIVILLMFIVLFQSLKLALITIVPNIFSAAVVLGVMGIFNIPLDLMTITIAAISVGIAVDNSIHFVARFKDDWLVSYDYESATDAATLNVGQAMLYTTVVITSGFLIMVLSNFVPTVYFGFLTALAMVTALFANLVMLPILIKRFKPQHLALGNTMTKPPRLKRWLARPVLSLLLLSVFAFPLAQPSTTTNNQIMALTTINEIPRIELQQGEGIPEYAIIWLHGLGATADDFVPIVPYLDLSDERAIKFVFPQAPDRPITINGGMRMPGWYDIKGVSIDDKQDAIGMNESAAIVAKLIAELEEQGIPSTKIMLFGFSQGGAVAYHQALRHPKPLAGLACLSTYLPFAENVEGQASVANKQIPIMVNHGSFDAVVPIAMGQASVAKLQELGYKVQWQQYPMEHQVVMEQIQALGAWINNIFEQRKRGSGALV